MVVGALGEQNRIVEPQPNDSGVSHSDLRTKSGGDGPVFFTHFFPADMIVRRTRGEPASYISPGQP